MKKEKQPEVTVGDELNVEFLKNSGRRPVCRINGKVGFIDNSYKGFIAPGSSWMVKITTISERHLQVIPIIQTHKAKENVEVLKATIKGIPEKTSVLPLSSKDKKQFQHRFYL